MMKLIIVILLIAVFCVQKELLQIILFQMILKFIKNLLAPYVKNLFKKLLLITVPTQIILNLILFACHTLNNPTVSSIIMIKLLMEILLNAVNANKIIILKIL